MTITFVPGEPSSLPQAVTQGLWRNHHLVVYVLGNNVIIALASIPPNHTPLVPTAQKLLQTIYFETNPEAVALNPDTGAIAVGTNGVISVYTPVNHYMKLPKWQSVGSGYPVDSSKITCMKWAYSENELFVSSELASVYVLGWDEDTYQWKRRWNNKLPSPVVELDVNGDGLAFVTRLNYDRLVKFWQRQTNVVFEVSYIPHPRGEWVTAFHLRGPRSLNLTPAVLLLDKVVEASDKRYLAHAAGNNDDRDVVYTVTNTGKVSLWASHEVGGHQHINLWGQYDFGGAYSVVVADSTLLPGDFDLLLAVDCVNYRYKAVAVQNINESYPSGVTFCPYSDWQPLPRYTFPMAQTPLISPSLTKEVATSYQFLRQLNPMVLSVDFLWPPQRRTNQIPPLLLLVHDRIKNTIRVDTVTVLETKTSLVLANKFQGHGKSIRMLFKLYLDDLTANVLLSTSNFCHHNFLWEPIFLGDNFNQRMLLAKRFEIDIGGSGDNHIEEAVIINDIQVHTLLWRRHLVAVVESCGRLLVWDCDSQYFEDAPAKLLYHQPVESTVLSFVVVPGKNKGDYYIIAVYGHDDILSWKLHVNLSGEVMVSPTTISPLPQDSPIHLISLFNTVNPKGNLLLVIDSQGRLCIYGVNETEHGLDWKLSFTVSTGVVNASKIHGSDVIDRVAVIDESGVKLTIWEIRSGVLEYEQTVESTVRDLDWTFTHTGELLPATNAILSVGFDRHVDLYTQLRYDYTNKVPTFAVVETVDISDYTLHVIGDSLWLNDCYLVIGCGNQFFVDDKWVRLRDRQMDNTIRQLLPSVEDAVYDINHLVGVLNGPIPVYHPQFLVQCLYLGQFLFVEEIFVRLFAGLRNDSVTWDLAIDFYAELKANGIGTYSKHAREHTPGSELEVFSHFNLTMAKMLVDQLTKVAMPLITRHQQLTLVLVILIVAELSKLLVLVDANGLRFLMGFKLFNANPSQKELTFRDVLWALHCENKPMIFGVVEQEYFKGKYTWSGIKAMGLVYWLDEAKFVLVMEQCCRYQFSELRDPLGLISLVYLALGKKQILLGLWRTVLHPEKTKMLKFFANDFNDPRWKLAANKNAYALLGKHRYMDAAYFFLLGSLPVDCCITLANKVGDVDLALAVAKLWHVTTSESKPVTTVIQNYIIPATISTGNRWRSLWVFWQMGQKELSIQALIKSPSEMFTEKVEKASLSSHLFLKDDPVLAVLFDDLRHAKVNYQKGAKGVSPLEEFDFIIRVCLIYTRMGCDYITLVMLQHWLFEHDVVVQVAPTLPVARRISIGDISSNGLMPNGLQRRMLTNELKTDDKASNKPPPPLTAFEEPDMLGFDFGF